MGMKVFVGTEINARSIKRIVDALVLHAPEGVEVVADRDKADLVVHTVVGVQNFAKRPVNELITEEWQRGQRYAIIQCCLASTEKPDTAFWGPLWQSASVVWSYLDLRAADQARLAREPDGPEPYQFNFYYAPLGVDVRAFNRDIARDRTITMLTTGYVAESEGVMEVSEAVRRVGGWHVHVGPNLGFGDHVTWVTGLTDEQFAGLYRRAQFVAGLRRCEGFELPAAEGLICGARPILFDAPHYRQWFDRWGLFVPEGSEPDVTDAIEKELRRADGWYVTPLESSQAAEVFDWAAVVGGFWKRAVSAGSMEWSVDGVTWTDEKPDMLVRNTYSRRKGSDWNPKEGDKPWPPGSIKIVKPGDPRFVEGVNA